MQINTNTIIIHWKQWWWKTLFAVLLAQDYIWRIFWNITITQNKKNIVAFMHDMSLLKQLEYSKKPWVVIFDEVWLNFNSKEYWSDKNKELTKFFFLVRKYNLSSIYVSQRFTSVPVDMRELADYIFEVSVVYRSWTYPVFRITRQILKAEWVLEFYDEYIFDIISYNINHGIEYDTLESSIID